MTAGANSAAARPGTHPREAAREAGFTLMELLVTTAIVIVTMGMTASVMVSTQRNYSAQQERIRTQQEARTAVDLMARLIRMTGNEPFPVVGLTPVNIDPNNNGGFDDIRIQADWNPADGDIADVYEDITFSVNPTTNQLLKFEPAYDAAPVPLAENVASLTFNYTDTNGAPITTAAAAARIAFATIDIRTRSTQQVQDGPALRVTTSVSIRSAEK